MITQLGNQNFQQETNVTTLNKQIFTDSSHHNYGILDWLLATVHTQLQFGIP